MRNLLLNMADSCNGQGVCGFMAKITSLWDGLGVHMQIGMQLISVLLLFLVLSKLFSCKVATSCSQGCKCGCGIDCTCKNDQE